jgi:acyl-CoA synthetase (AMP-forming)/AMP-acid ligase II
MKNRSWEDIEMSFLNGRIARIVAASFLLAIVAVPVQLLSQDHVVSSADLQKQTAASANLRQQNIQTLQKTFSNPKVESALKAANMDASQVKTAVATLSDGELAQLTARANHAQQDFSGGRMDDRDLLLILVAIAALILIIVAVR